MKYFMIVCALLMPFLLMAADVPLVWDPSPSQVDGYALFDRNYEKPYNYTSPTWTGDALSATISVTGDRQSEIVARAYAWGAYDLQGNRIKIWSEDSNKVLYTPASVVPLPPRNVVGNVGSSK